MTTPVNLMTHRNIENYDKKINRINSFHQITDDGFNEDDIKVNDAYNNSSLDVQSLENIDIKSKARLREIQTIISVKKDNKRISVCKKILQFMRDCCPCLK